LLASGINQCEYCVAVHLHVGQQAGLIRDELICNLQGEASNPESQAVLNFTKAVVNNRGKVDESTVGASHLCIFSFKALILRALCARKMSAFSPFVRVARA
jgi:AhpD family alkylhydroperoxidase